MNKIIKSMQIKLLALEESMLDELSKESNDEAIKITLILASYPAPPMPEFLLDKTYDDAEKLADAIDDTLGKVGDEKSYKENFMNEYASTTYAHEKITLTDAEAIKTCNEWKTKYDVTIGVSWGNLPFDLQQKWLEYSCDYHMNSDVKSKVSSSSNLNDEIEEEEEKVESRVETEEKEVEEELGKEVEEFD
jgi:hypothetical protein